MKKEIREFFTYGNNHRWIVLKLRDTITKDFNDIARNKSKLDIKLKNLFIAMREYFEDLSRTPLTKKCIYQRGVVTYRRSRWRVKGIIKFKLIEGYRLYEDMEIYKITIKDEAYYYLRIKDTFYYTNKNLKLETIEDIMNEKVHVSRGTGVVRG